MFLVNDAPDCWFLLQQISAAPAMPARPISFSPPFSVDPRKWQGSIKPNTLKIGLVSANILEGRNPSAIGFPKADGRKPMAEGLVMHPCSW